MRASAADWFKRLGRPAKVQESADVRGDWWRIKHGTRWAASANADIHFPLHHRVAHGWSDFVTEYIAVQDVSHEQLMADLCIWSDTRACSKHPSLRDFASVTNSTRGRIQPFLQWLASTTPFPNPVATIQHETRIAYLPLSCPPHKRRIINGDTASTPALLSDLPEGIRFSSIASESLLDLYRALPQAV
ncbi:uncharacterized protein BT62DRAFT_1007603 [Guyanagaster necrorhizus]|uniref:Uncharacterized protein n=1 Tax=Guyanagaster necrorhizus TaxID=856835 RepID=A0A9P7VQI8_9AGAR|nr:uncharacterized protein BT62DRAFT_1007603 [Guyanagaster necrorhizus MCA 3950]KAG7444600.1 hypothetical protein BT62DRAFT_1007603 [Guyanagaster necrorhizus MCA 3950]